MSDPTDTRRQVETPGNVFVECPLAGKKLVPVARCNKCEHYVGLLERFPDEKIPFAKRFMVGCRHPFARALFEVDLNAGTE